MGNALCISKSAVFNGEPAEGDVLNVFDSNSDIFNLDSFIIDRAICETDFNLLQLIPYITLKDKDTGRLFVYSRGKGSGEQGLVCKCSIGLGGHVEEGVSQSKNLLTVLAEAAARELNEEVGLEYTPELIEKIKDLFQESRFMVMYNNRSNVDKVHLAIHFHMDVEVESLGKHEEGVITKGEWLTPRELRLKFDNQEIDLEHWSRMALFNNQNLS
jgi:predicted NUDIX family phosphoesterase